MTKDTALRLALRALESTGENNGYHGVTQYFDETMVDQAITAIKAALEAKDEPVAWMYEVNHAHTCLDLFEPPDDAYDEGTLYPLYTTPPQRTPITDEDIRQANHHMVCGAYDYSFKQGVRWAEKVHGIKWEWEK